MNFLNSSTTDFDSNNDDWTNKNKMTIKQLEIQQIARINTLASVEFRGGYYKTQISFEGNNQGLTESRTYVPDTREEYCNAIMQLYRLVQRYFKTDLYVINKCKESIEHFSNIMNRIKNLKDEVILKTELKESVVLTLDSYSGKDRQVIDEYKQNKVEIYGELFEACVQLLEMIETQNNVEDEDLDDETLGEQVKKYQEFLEWNEKEDEQNKKV